MNDLADLHIHSVFSDGTKTPEEIFKMAAEKNLRAISITDHDSIDAYSHAKQLSDEYNVEFVTGIELSSYERDKEYHILGYNINIHNDNLIIHLDRFRRERFIRAEKMIRMLKGLSVNITMDSILDKAGEAPIIRPHIASVLLEKGFVKTMKEAFNNYIADGAPAYVPKNHFPLHNAIRLINECGGVAVLAHPAKSVSQEALYRMIEMGLDGIEVVHPQHDEAMSKHYLNIANQYWLIPTGGSDYHGSRDYDDSNFGKYIVSYSIAQSLRNRIGKY